MESLLNSGTLLHSQSPAGLVKGHPLVNGLEKEIELKAQLFADGVRVDPAALAGVPDIYYGYPATAPFTHRQRPRRLDLWWPDNLVLPLGTKCKVYSDYNSPFVVRRENGSLFIEKHGRFVSTCEWGKRPADFEDTVLADGKTRAGDVVTLVCGCYFIVQQTMVCGNWARGEQCLYCDIYHPEKISSLMEIIAATRKPTFSMGGAPEQVAEAAAIARRLDYDFHYIFVGGFSPNYNFFIPYINAIKERTGGTQLRGAIAIGAPKRLSDLDTVHELGLTGINLDMEVWHPGMFAYICPGKTRRIGRDNWLKALAHAARIFPPGNTATAQVTGLEAKKDYLEAAHWFSDRGILMVACAYQPFWGTALEGHRPPAWQWLLDVSSEVQDILDQSLPTGSDEFFDAGVATCYNCNLYSLLWDLVRLRRGATVAVDQKGHLIKLGAGGWQRQGVEGEVGASQSPPHHAGRVSAAHGNKPPRYM